MDKDALLHQPQNPIPLSASWNEQQRVRIELQNMVDAALKSGIKIKTIETGVSGEKLASLTPPKITEEKIAWAHAQHYGMNGRNLISIAKDLGMSEYALRNKLRAYRKTLDGK